jgi:hypothetical protein
MTNDKAQMTKEFQKTNDKDAPRGFSADKTMSASVGLGVTGGRD